MGIDKLIVALRNVVIGAKVHGEIWRTLAARQNRKRFKKGFKSHESFLAYAVRANFLTTICLLYILGETKKGRAGIPLLLQELRKLKLLSPQLIKRFEQRIKPIWMKVCTLRNNVFAHVNLQSDPSFFFKQVRLTPNQIKRLTRNAENLLNSVTRAVNRDTHAFNLGGKQLTLSVLKKLNG